MVMGKRCKPVRRGRSFSLSGEMFLINSAVYISYLLLIPY